MEGKVSKIYSEYCLGVAYASGTDGNLASPDDSWDQNDNFLPANAGGDCNVYLGGKVWNYTAVNPGIGRTFTGTFSGGGYGSLTLRPVAGNWANFAASSLNGLQKIWFPKSAGNDKLGGYSEIYYNNVAFIIAFNGNNSHILITEDESVYRDSISIVNLVTTHDGVIGIAGGGFPTQVISIAKHGEHIVL